MIGWVRNWNSWEEDEDQRDCEVDKRRHWAQQLGANLIPPNGIWYYLQLDFATAYGPTDPKTQTSKYLQSTFSENYNKGIHKASWLHKFHLNLSNLIVFFFW